MLDSTIDRVYQGLTKTKDLLYDSTDTGTVDDSLVKIANLDEIDPALHEVIIILYSKFKSDTQLLRSSSFKVLGKTIDSVWELTTAMQYIIDAVEAAELAKKKRSGLITRFLYIGSVLTVLSLFILVIFSIFKQDNETGKLVIELIKSITGLL